MSRQKMTDVPRPMLLAFLTLLVAGSAMQGCGLFSLGVKDPGKGGGGGTGGAGGGDPYAGSYIPHALGSGGPEGPIYLGNIPPPGDQKNQTLLTQAPEELYRHVYLKDFPIGKSKKAFSYGAASIKVASGTGCERACFAHIPECEARCAEFHELVKDNPHKSNPEIKKHKKSPCPTFNTNSGMFRTYSWQLCYKFVYLCLERCAMCTWPKTMSYQESGDKVTSWMCRCPDGSGAKKDAPCQSNFSTERMLTWCSSECGRKVVDCRDDKEEAYIYEHGVLSESAAKKFENQCNAKFKSCFKKCKPGIKLIEKFFAGVQSGNMKEFKKGYDYVFVENGWSVNFSGDDGVTPLHHAAGKGYFEMVVMLVEAGAPIWVEDHHGARGWFFIPDKQNRTPIDHARDAGFTDIVEYLENLPPPSGG